MNYATHFLKVYCQINLLFGVTYIIFRVTRSQWIENSKIEKWVFLRLAQGGVILSLVTPLAISLVPTQHLPSMEWSSARMLLERNPEGEGTPTSKTKSVHQPLPAPNLGGAGSHTLHEIYMSVFQNQWAEILFFLIGIGILISFLQLMHKSRRLKELLGASIPIRTLGRVMICVSESAQIPFAVRMSGRAYVVIPSSLVASLSDFKVAVRHEIQHHRQGDTLWAVLTEWLTCLFFINPTIYSWKKVLIEFQEFSCDEALIGRKRISSYDYGICLARVAESALEYRAMLVGTTGMAFHSKDPVYFKSFLRRRIEMFDVYSLQNGRSKGQKKVGIILGTMTAMITVAFAYGSERSFRQKSSLQVNPGEAVMDSKIQAIADRILGAELAKSDALAGFVLVSDPNTGKLLAVANQIRDQSVVKSGKYWALSHQMAAASTTKPIIAGAAIEKGVTRIDQSHNCENGTYKVGGRVFHDHSRFPFLTTARAVAESSDICSMKIGEKLGVQGLDQALKNYGFGPGGSAQDFPGALSGSYPLPSEVPTMDYIHMVTVGGAESDLSEPLRFYTTPLEVLYAYGAIANGGNLMRPLASTESDSKAQVVRRVLSELNAKQVQGALALTVTEGTGKNARSALYSTAGKTSTGHFQISAGEKIEKLGLKSNFGGFAGFAPLGKPRVAVYAVVFSPKNEVVYGGTHAAPVFRRVVEEVLQHMNVASDQK